MHQVVPGNLVTVAVTAAVGIGELVLQRCPRRVVFFQPEWGAYGCLVGQPWSFAGDDDRRHVNQTLIEPFVNYNLKGGW